MASTPKKRTLLKTLEALAREELGPKATGGAWYLAQIEAARTVGSIAAQLEVRMGESCSRTWLTSTMNRNPELKAKIQTARKLSAAAMLEEAIDIADSPAGDTAEVQRNRLRADTRVRLAAMFNREDYGPGPAVSVKLDVGALHLQALRQRAVAGTTPAADVNQIGSGDIVDAEVIGIEE